ncbi:histidine phosphatase family protein [Paenibacillus kobensis]|uniref:histidine phosphatase family protein n=1 Tax=Paenibacillus kobensis TaxID=59841 RepID=UPI001FE6C0D7|nr:histidine phosphatase family protein [Paenibacillus kobensis]
MDSTADAHPVLSEYFLPYCEIMGRAKDINERKVVALYPKLMVAFLIHVVVFLFATTESDASQLQSGNGLSPFDELKKGGYIIYLRHGEATVGQDLPDLNFNNCSTQRNLSDNGREQARAVEALFSKKQIPIQYPIISSPYCRARETAGIIFGNQNIVVNPVLASIEKLKIEDYPADKKQQIVRELTKIFETPPALGTNSVIVAHTFPPNVALGEIPNLGAVILKPKGMNQGYEIIHRFNIEDLNKLSSGAYKPKTVSRQ